jgi:2-iminobutanoate/2-iminopropanoate deaminase
MMHRLRVEPYSSYLERRRKGPIYPVTIAGDFIFLSGLPPFERGTGEIKRLSFERQAEIVLMQMQKCLEAAGSSLAKVLKCNVYCTPEPAHFAMFNDIYARYFPSESTVTLSPGRWLGGLLPTLSLNSTVIFFSARTVLVFHAHDFTRSAKTSCFQASDFNARRASSCTSLLSPARSISKLIAWRSFSYGGNGRLCPLLMLWTAPTLRHQKCHRVVA